MSEPSDRLIAAELSAALAGSRVGNEIVVVEEAESTNDLVWKAVERGVPEGFVVFGPVAAGADAARIAEIDGAAGRSRRGNDRR